MRIPAWVSEVPTVAKAIASGCTAAAAAITAATADGTGISGSEWLTIAGAVLAAFGITWFVPNAPQSIAKAEFGSDIMAAASLAQKAEYNPTTLSTPPSHPARVGYNDLDQPVENN